MTIGIGAIGPNAGLAVWKGLNCAERVTSGSIGGFATFAIMDEDQKVHYYCTQRGGSRTLFTFGDSVLTEPPEEVAKASLAAVISSGPDRTEPLTMYLASEDGVGMVTGHRIPSAVGVDGIPVNLQVLALMKEGVTAEQAVSAVMEKNPSVDAGLIAIDVNGSGGMMDSHKVEQRPDHASKTLSAGDVKVFVLNNEIYPVGITAEVAAAIAFETMTGEREADFRISISAGLKVQFDHQDKIVINDENEAVEIYTSDRTVLKAETVCVVPYLGSLVIHRGTVIGRLMNEPITLLRDGVIVKLAGADRIVRDVSRL